MRLTNLFGKSPLAIILLGARFVSTLGYSFALYRYGKGDSFSESIYALLFFDYLYGSIGYIFRNAIIFERVSRTQVVGWLIIFSLIGTFVALFYNNSTTSVLVVCIGAVMFPFYVLVAADIEKEHVTLVSIIETVGALSGALIGVVLVISYSFALITDFSLAYRPLIASLVVSAFGYVFAIRSERELLESSASRILPMEVIKNKGDKSLALPGLVYLTVLMIFKNNFFETIGGVFVGLKSDAMHKEFLRLFASIYDPIAALCGLLLRWKLLATKKEPKEYLRTKIRLFYGFLLIALGGGCAFFWHQSTLSLALFGSMIFICLAAFQASLLFSHRNLEFIISGGLLFLTGIMMLLDIPVQALAIAGIFIIVVLRWITVRILLH